MAKSCKKTDFKFVSVQDDNIDDDDYDDNNKWIKTEVKLPNENWNILQYAEQASAWTASHTKRTICQHRKWKTRKCLLSSSFRLCLICSSWVHWLSMANCFWCDSDDSLSCCCCCNSCCCCWCFCTKSICHSKENM